MHGHVIKHPNFSIVGGDIQMSVFKTSPTMALGVFSLRFTKEAALTNKEGYGLVVRLPSSSETTLETAGKPG